MTENQNTERNGEARRQPLKALRLLKNILLTLLTLILVAVAIATAVTRISGSTPSLFGYSIYRISSESMKPNLRTGELILCRVCAPEDIVEGDIITYEGEVGEFAGKNVTHRVVRAPYSESDGVYIVTKGDDNPAEDTPIEVSRVKGRFVCKLRALRLLYDFFSSPWGIIALAVLVVFAFSGELISLVRRIIQIPDKK